MRKILLLITFINIFYSNVAFANQCNRLDIDIQLFSDGSAQITETWIFKSNKEFIFVRYLTIDRKKEITNIKLFENNIEKIVLSKPKWNNPDNSFVLEKTITHHKVKSNIKADIGEKVIEFSYLIKRFVLNGKNLSELNYKFSNDYFGIRIEDLNINVYFPNEINKNEMYVYTEKYPMFGLGRRRYYPDGGHTELNENIVMDKLDKFTIARIRLFPNYTINFKLFMPKGIFAESDNESNKNIYTLSAKQVSVVEKDVLENKTKKEKSTIEKIFSWGVLLFLLYISVFYKSKKA